METNRKTRCYHRTFEFDLFIHVNIHNEIETRMDILKYETGMPELNKYVIGSSFDPAPWNRGQQYIIPNDIKVVDFILQFTRNGKIPNDAPKHAERIEPNTYQFDNWGNSLGKIVFTYEVNEYLEKQAPMDKLPWRCRVFDSHGPHKNSEATCYWEFREPCSMKAWLNKSKIIKSVNTQIQKIENLQTFRALKKLREV